MRPKDADWMANNVDPDQTALGTVWSGSALFAQTCLSENLGSLPYTCCFQIREKVHSLMAPNAEVNMAYLWQLI